MEPSKKHSMDLVSSTQPEPVNEDMEGTVTQPGTAAFDEEIETVETQSGSYSQASDADMQEAKDSANAIPEPAAKKQNEQAEDSTEQPTNVNDVDETAENKQQPPTDAVKDATNDLSSLEWDDLQHKFAEEMMRQTEEENKLKDQFRNLTSLYLDWASVPAVREEQRAAKRLRTRIAYVKHEEAHLEERQRHMDNVRDAFEKAISMLNI